MYRPSGRPTAHLIPVLLSHGYNENQPGTYLHYSFLGEFLAAHGCFVVSIQHELPEDAPLAMSGDLRALRRPNWERGAANIGYVLLELQRTHPELDHTSTTLIGHSNGGDISALFTDLHPGLIANLITLDNRRYPLPRSREPRVLSLRSSDAPADAGVLPTAEEARRFDMSIVPLNNVEHNEMSDRGDPEQREDICRLIQAFLEKEGRR